MICHLSLHILSLIILSLICMWFTCLNCTSFDCLNPCFSSSCVSVGSARALLMSAYPRDLNYWSLTRDCVEVFSVLFDPCTLASTKFKWDVFIVIGDGGFCVNDLYCGRGAVCSCCLGRLVWKSTSDSCIVMFLLCLTFQSSLSFCFNEAGVAYIILVGHVGPPSVRLYNDEKTEVTAILKFVLYVSLASFCRI